VSQQIVRAEVVRHQPGDPENAAVARKDTGKAKDTGCSLQ
jgi:hypothetical protein